MPRVTGIAPFFLVADVVRAAEYYRDKLGFTIRGYFFEDPPVFAMVGRDDQIVMLSLMTAGRGGSNRNHNDDALDAYDLGRRRRCAVCRVAATPGRHRFAAAAADLRHEGARGPRPRRLRHLLRRGCGYPRRRITIILIPTHTGRLSCL